MTNDKRCQKGIIVFLAFSAILISPRVQAQGPENQITTWKGTLTDSGCCSPKAESHSGSMNSGAGTNAAKVPRSEVTSGSASYPATSSTTSFALVTKDGKCIPLDEDSNEKVLGLLKINTNWSENSAKIEPTQVEVVGTNNGGTISVDEIEFMKWPNSFAPATPNSWPVK